MPNQVLVVNTYPVNSNINWNDFNENLTKDAEYFKGFDRVFVPSSLMSNYFHNKLNLPVNKIYIQQDKLHKSLFLEKSEPILSENEKPPRVIFLGNSNFSLRTIDDVRNILRKIANQGVEVYIQDGGDKVECENIKYYTPFTYQEMLAGKLSQYIQGFDAVLVIYNNLENLRANISYPTRFAMATLGIDVPIIIKKGQFKAIDEIYSKTNRLLHYESEKELINICKNKSKLSLLRSEIRLKKNSQLDLMTKDEITKMLMCCDVD
ncbi:hypothetical protein MKR81_15070 [Vibrio campbellii]|uniref:hypothetical protein n=1 Tax=Vibrio campbellii TaxID=680 RepID=UPI001F082D7E|nr:hypothetical protein [Vibrio campbellii]UMM02854.1 hypothetical protein MKR81_15070 [Vibrio campbellii]